MKTIADLPIKRGRVSAKILWWLFQAVVLAAFCYVAGCAALQERLKGAAPAGGDTKSPEIEAFAQAKALFAEGHYEAALKENQRILSERKISPDTALFNLGLISAYSLNPKKDYPTALTYFKRLLSQHPESSLAEQSKVWVQVLEERQTIADDRQKLLEEKRVLMRERENLSQEREKLKNAVEKSRQLDIQIDKRRRQILSK
jgi:tetratricopeptide (TPR) repeat protein